MALNMLNLDQFKDGERIVTYWSNDGGWTIRRKVDGGTGRVIGHLAGPFTLIDAHLTGLTAKAAAKRLGQKRYHVTIEGTLRKDEQSKPSMVYDAYGLEEKADQARDIVNRADICILSSGKMQVENQEILVPYVELTPSAHQAVHQSRTRTKKEPTAKATEVAAPAEETEIIDDLTRPKVAEALATAQKTTEILRQVVDEEVSEEDIDFDEPKAKAQGQ